MTVSIPELATPIKDKKDTSRLDMFRMLETTLQVKKAHTKGTTGWSPKNDPAYSLVDGRWKKTGDGGAPAPDATPAPATAAIAPKDPKKKYAVGDKISKPDGSIWEKISPFNWREVEPPNSAPLEVVPEPDDAVGDEEDKEALDSAIKKMGNLSSTGVFWSINKGEFAQLCKAYGVTPEATGQKAKLETLEKIRDLMVQERDENFKKDAAENTVKLAKLKPYSNVDMHVEQGFRINREKIKLFPDGAGIEHEEMLDMQLHIKTRLRGPDAAYWQSVYGEIYEGGPFTSTYDYVSATALRDSRIDPRELEKEGAIERVDGFELSGETVRKFLPSKHVIYDKEDAPVRISVNGFYKAALMDSKSLEDFKEKVQNADPERDAGYYGHISLKELLKKHPKQFKAYYDQMKDRINKLRSAKNIEEVEDYIEPDPGFHWGSAKSDNRVARAVAFSSGMAFKPIDFMEGGKLQRHAQGVSMGDMLLGVSLRKYAQKRLEGNEMSRDAVPVFYRGQTLPPEAVESLLSGESDTIELTGCTAMTCYPKVMDRYANSIWTQGFGAEKIPVKLHITRTDDLDDSIGMFHRTLHEKHSGNSNTRQPFFEALSGAEALRVVRIEKSPKLKDPDDFGKWKGKQVKKIQKKVDETLEGAREEVKALAKDMGDFDDRMYDAFGTSPEFVKAMGPYRDAIGLDWGSARKDSLASQVPWIMKPILEERMSEDFGDHYNSNSTRPMVEYLRSIESDADLEAARKKWSNVYVKVQEEVEKRADEALKDIRALGKAGGLSKEDVERYAKLTDVFKEAVNREKDFRLELIADPEKFKHTVAYGGLLGSSFYPSTSVQQYLREREDLRTIEKGSMDDEVVKKTTETMGYEYVVSGHAKAWYEEYKKEHEAKQKSKHAPVFHCVVGRGKKSVSGGDIDMDEEQEGEVQKSIWRKKWQRVMQSL